MFADKTEIPDTVKLKSNFALEVSKKDKWWQKSEIAPCNSLVTLKEEVKKKCYAITRAGITNFVLTGSQTLRQLNHQFGEGLQWSKLNYRFRQEAIKYYLEKAIIKFLAEPDFIQLQNACILHALPDAMSVAEA